MKNHLGKSVPDRVLIGMILQAILKAEDAGMELTSKEIHMYVSNPDVEWFFESPDLDQYNKPLWGGTYTYDNLAGIRTGLSYCIRAGYVMKRGVEKPFVFILTNEGKLYANDPFFKYKLKQQYFMKLAAEEVKRLLNTDERIEYEAEQKRIEKCKTCKLNQPSRERLRAKTWTVKPHRGKIGIQRKDGKIVEVLVTDEGMIQELEDLKASLVTKNGKVDVESSILSLQNENAVYRNALVQAGIDVGKLNTQLEKQVGRKTARTEKEFVRQMDRMGLAHYYVENGMVLDAEFFEIWGGSLVVVEYKRTLDMQILSVYYDIQSTRSEIMTRTDYTRRILELDEISAIGIYVTEIREGSIMVDSPHFQAPKPLKV